MKVPRHLGSTVAAIGDAVKRIRLYQTLVLVSDIGELPPALRRALGLVD